MFEKICLIPYSIFLGAYHILTNYLKTNPTETASQLINTAMISRDFFYSTINAENIKIALDKAAELKIESWDGYLISIMNLFQIKIIYSIDKRLADFFNVINPISEKTMKKYHEWVTLQLNKKIKK